MSEGDAQTNSFAYRAQMNEGYPISGTIHAPNAEHAREQLAAMRLRVIELEPAEKSAKPRTFSGDEFIAFNEQLAHLTSAGMPIERGLRLIAQDMSSGRLAATIREVVDELEKGKSLQEAFEMHRGRFPAMYGKLLDAGVQTNDLPSMLLNLGRHLELVQRLRSILWRTLTYPIVIMFALLLMLGFVGMVIAPGFERIFEEFATELPQLTIAVFAMSDLVPYILLLSVLLIVGWPLLWMLARTIGFDQALVEGFALPMPLIGSVLKRNMIARWCDAVRIGVRAGLDLPKAIDLASDATGSGVLHRDGERLVDAIEKGLPLEEGAGCRFLPPTVPAAIDLGTKFNDLPTTLDTLAEMYQKQAELRVGMTQALMAPILLIVLANIMGVVVVAMFLPLVKLIQSVTG